jgi:hypothetical protein
MVTTRNYYSFTPSSYVSIIPTISRYIFSMINNLSTYTRLRIVNRTIVICPIPEWSPELIPSYGISRKSNKR